MKGAGEEELNGFLKTIGIQGLLMNMIIDVVF